MDTFGRENPFLPSDASNRLLRLLWQLEVWLREMVYVELRARHADWKKPIADVVKNWPPRSIGADKRLTHMTTRHEGPISYLTLGELLQVIQGPTNWPLFESYFPPRDIFISKMTEISQIRHRVAHFRDPHRTDVDRVVLFLRDLDKGIWQFTTSYARSELYISDGTRDSVSEYFNETHLQRPTVEMKTFNGQWMHSANSMNPALHFGLCGSWRPWFIKEVESALIDRQGFVYHGFYMAAYDRFLDLDRILESTKSVHANCMHVRISSRSIEVTIPSILGRDLVVDTLETFLERCMSSAHRGERADGDRVEKTASAWPEYVLGPSNPLGDFGSDVECTIFAMD